MIPTLSVAGQSRDDGPRRDITQDPSSSLNIQFHVIRQIDRSNAVDDFLVHGQCSRYDQTSTTLFANLSDRCLKGFRIIVDAITDRSKFRDPQVHDVIIHASIPKSRNLYV
jgi:hypothetical protein